MAQEENEEIKKVKRYFPYLFRDFKGTWPSNLGAPFIPLKLSNCNGLLPYSFSNAEVDVMAYPFDPANTMMNLKRKGVTDVYLYMGAIYDLVFNKEYNRNLKIKALENLGKFLTSGHISCLLLMSEDEEKLSECELQSILAIHLFGPLMPDSEIRVDASRYKGNSGVTECKYCYASVKMDNTSFGNYKVWHGSGDILLDYSVVKVTTQSETETADSEKAQCDDEREDDPGEAAEPRAKRAKSSGEGDAGGSGDEALASNTIVELSSEDYMPNGPKKISFTNVIPNLTLSQILAQTVTNAFLQVKRKNQLKRYFIPSFLASDKFVTIHMYNPVDDVLLTQSEAMPLWLPNGELNFTNILSIWMALHMPQFSRCCPYQGNQINFHEKSHFRTLVGNRWRIYKKELTMPLGKLTHDNVDFSTEYGESLVSVAKMIERMESEENLRERENISVDPN